MLTRPSAEPDYFQLLEYQERGIPIGRAAEVNLRNNHAQYIFTWYVQGRLPMTGLSNGSTFADTAPDSNQLTGDAGMALPWPPR